MPIQWEFIIQLGAFGVLVWVLVYLLKITIPRLVDSFSKTLGEQRREFIEELNQNRDIMIQSLREHKSEMKKIVCDNTKALNELRIEIARGKKE